MLKQIEKIPPVQWASRHPRLAAWIVLAAGMVILLAIEARDVGLLPTQWLALMGAAVLVAGACVWIISWEDEDESEEGAQEAAASEAAPTTRE
jgi:hypothetical protein